MNKVTDKKKVSILALVFSAAYMISYITRINYGAVISEMETAEGISRSLLSMAVTGSFVTYGTGQIVSGILGDRFSPKRLLSLGFLVTILMNLLIPLCTSPYQMLGVWCINGFAQSFMWPPMVRLMTALLTEEDYKRVTVKVSFGSSVGTIFVYLISPAIIAFSGWRGVFVFSAVCGAVMLLIWTRCPYDAPSEQKSSCPEDSAAKGRLFTPLMIFIMIAIILQGMLRDGVTTWMPTYISDTYNLSSIISILTGVVLPVFSMACFHISSNLYRRVLTNPMTCAGAIFGVGVVSALGLYLCTGANAALSVVFSALLTGAMHGVNLILICMVPPFFGKHGNVSTVSGVLNSCTYIGSAISTYGIALISERAGWSFTLLIWIAIAMAGTAICFGCIRLWKNKMV